MIDLPVLALSQQLGQPGIEKISQNLTIIDVFLRACQFFWAQPHDKFH